FIDLGEENIPGTNRHVAQNNQSGFGDEITCFPQSIQTIRIVHSLFSCRTGGSCNCCCGSGHLSSGRCIFSKCGDRNCRHKSNKKAKKKIKKKIKTFKKNFFFKKYKT